MTSNVEDAGRLVEGVIRRLRRAIDVDETEFPVPLLGLLGGQRLIVADIGSAGGPEMHWDPFRQACAFYLFDPNDSGASQSKKHDRHFPVGLWSATTDRTLSVTRFESASSVLALNHDVLDQYLNGPCHEVVDQRNITLEPMETVLQGLPAPEFIKLDAEGADLEILRGAGSLLGQSLGIQVEVPFIDRQKDAPTFCDIDSFLRERKFALFDITREHWIRDNGTFSLRSRPQLAWGNALYFVETNVLLQRLRDLIPSQRVVTSAKMVVVLLAYRAHDRALAVIRRIVADGLITSEVGELLERCVDANVSGDRRYVVRLTLALFAAAVIAALCLPLPSARSRARRAFRLRLRRLLAALEHATARSGPYDACIADPE